MCQDLIPRVKIKETQVVLLSNHSKQEISGKKNKNKWKWVEIIISSKYKTKGLFFRYLPYQMYSVLWPDTSADVLNLLPKIDAFSWKQERCWGHNLHNSKKKKGKTHWTVDFLQKLHVTSAWNFFFELTVASCNSLNWQRSLQAGRSALSDASLSCSQAGVWWWVAVLWTPRVLRGCWAVRLGTALGANRNNVNPSSLGAVRMVAFYMNFIIL